MGNILIQAVTVELWPEVVRIYESGITTRNAMFQATIPDWSSWNQNHRKDCRIVATIENKVAGWVALSNVSSRCVYAGVAEVSIYVDPSYQEKGIGNKLMKPLISESGRNGIWTLQARTFPENKASKNYITTTDFERLE